MSTTTKRREASVSELCAHFLAEVSNPLFATMDLENKVKLEQMLREITEFEVLLDGTLDSSLTDPFIDPNRYIKQYNDYLREMSSLLDDEVIVDILTEISPYAYTGDDRTDVINTKQRLVEVYLKTTQLVAYLQALLELE